MSREWLLILVPLAALGSGLIAGVFFAFSTFVMKALAKLPPAQGIAAMQAINIVVINPWFMAAFLGTAALCLASAVVVLISWPAGAAWLLAASALYVIGTLGVTMVCNVPRNNKLAALAAESAAGAEYWPHYIAEWTFWNHLRTAAAFAAAAGFVLALLAG